MKSRSVLPSHRSTELAESLRLAIHQGNWSIGSALPTTRQIASQHKISLATVQAAFRTLEDQGLIECRSRRGVFVRSGTPSQPSASELGIQHIAIVGRQDSGHSSARETWAYQIIHSAQNALSRFELHPTLVYYDPNSGDPVDQLKGQLTRFGNTLVGVIVFNSPRLAKLYDWLGAVGLPRVVINRPDRESIENFVSADNLLGCQLVGECFARMNCRRLLILMRMGIDRSEGEREKVTGLLQGFIRAGVPLHGIDYLLCGQVESTFPLVQEYLRGHSAAAAAAPQAIFALDDDMASGAMEACAEAGLAVPDDLKVVGGAGLEIARHTRPALTVIAQPMAEMGDQAAKMIAEMIRANTRRIARRRIRSRFIVRESFPVPEEVLRELEQQYPGMVENQCVRT